MMTRTFGSNPLQCFGSQSYFAYNFNSGRIHSTRLNTSILLLQEPKQEQPTKKLIGKEKVFWRKTVTTMVNQINMT
ncbi:hypothetical protein Y1Q_0002332 [Alligator mississippiensis]|uniref:Uncharacterized protein n=1 Tax=Alligator mississippiensis TaxID=8496 RepID=A0A151MGR9_ALLMI|nr:hypothetical protein Y1Q_0002332 [Alligator mississippiensis]